MRVRLLICKNTFLNALILFYTRCFIITGPPRLLPQSVEIDEILQKRISATTVKISHFTFKTTIIKTYKPFMTKTT